MGATISVGLETDQRGPELELLAAGPPSVLG